MRKLATIRAIDNIVPIEGATAIETAVIGGWTVVVKKDQYKTGDKICYVEIDAWVPSKVAPFLSKDKEPKEYEGIKGERLKTIRLRGQLSQGLVLSLDDCGIFQESVTTWKITTVDGNQYYIDPNSDDDISQHLGIIKYEPPIPSSLMGKIKGTFPSCGRKTDEERCQNLKTRIEQAYDTDEVFEVSIKMDGSSMSVLKDFKETVHVCSRNYSIDLDNQGNKFVDVAVKYDLINKFRDLENIQISGELVGEGIQKNKDNLKGQDFFVYSIYDMKKGLFVSPDVRYNIVEQLGLKHVPVIHQKVTLRELGLDCLQKIIDFADGKGYNCDVREGVVFKSWSEDFSFKSISNKFLEKYNE